LRTIISRIGQFVFRPLNYFSRRKRNATAEAPIASNASVDGSGADAKASPMGEITCVEKTLGPLEVISSISPPPLTAVNQPLKEVKIQWAVKSFTSCGIGTSQKALLL
jgi:hypothetical protein